jgi:hypothetical protein
VTISGSVEALGGEIVGQSGRFGGQGYIRLDAYGTAPVISGRADPQPLVLELPHLRETIPARIGERVGLGISSAPQDVVAVFLGLRSAAVPLPPYGVVRLDSTAGLWLLAAPRLSAADDAMAGFVMPIPDNRLLDGLALHWQALSIITETRRPRLSNLVVTTIRP